MFKIEFNSYNKGKVVLSITKKIMKQELTFKFKFKCCDGSKVEYLESLDMDASTVSTNAYNTTDIIFDVIDKFQGIEIDMFDEWWASEDGIKLVKDVDCYIDALFKDEVK